ncbi:MAG: HAMP domain-containing histidine kinase [Clostridia bacterium]|nr:HAMP domain-containing histidine kinase [Clostridia bacterium]
MKKKKLKLNSFASNIRNRYTLAFILGVATILILCVMIVVILEYFIIQSKLVEQHEVKDSGLMWIILFGLASVIVGMGLSALLGRFILTPVNMLIEGMERLSNGDFTTRIDIDKRQGLKPLAKSFNTLASELQNTEILRSDFVNNFSHELKTPLVSVNGLISLLKNENLSPDKRKQYLEIIEEETNRLAELTTNLLNLSKIEKQEILTDKTNFNVSEQIRTCVLLLEKKWEKKDIGFSLDIPEIFINGNEDLMKQVWINVIDNAIKFADLKSEITFDLQEKEQTVEIAVSNQGKLLDESEYGKIFNKFYQIGKQGSREGNGIGLSIVKRIVELHSGKINVISKDGLTTFTVSLPKTI